MKTEHLDYLLEVIKCRSINKASKKLHLNHQYLSQIISAVEEECGVKLVERTRLGIELTEAGRQALPQMEAISRQFHALLASFQPVLAASSSSTACPASIRSSLAASSICCRLSIPAWIFCCRR